MKAFFLHGARDLRAADLPKPVPGPGEVLVAMRRAGICGSDIHYFSHGRVGSFIPKHPFVLGHEFAGEIVEVGTGVSATRIGERVTVDPSMPCGSCDFCRGGRYNLCLAMRFYGSASCDPHINGGFEEFILAPAANAFAVPDTLRPNPCPSRSTPQHAPEIWRAARFWSQGVAPSGSCRPLWHASSAPGPWF
jgi:L-idonate 5-dehydrogenase